MTWRQCYVFRRKNWSENWLFWLKTQLSNAKNWLLHWLAIKTTFFSPKIGKNQRISLYWHMIGKQRIFFTVMQDFFSGRAQLLRSWVFCLVSSKNAGTADVTAGMKRMNSKFMSPETGRKVDYFCFKMFRPFSQFPASNLHSSYLSICAFIWEITRSLAELKGSVLKLQNFHSFFSIKNLLIWPKTIVPNITTIFRFFATYICSDAKLKNEEFVFWYT
jgi:hypothetical protein